MCACSCWCCYQQARCEASLLVPFHVGCSGTNFLFMEGSIKFFLHFLNGKLSSNPDLWRIGLSVQTGGLGQVPLLLKVVKGLWLWSSVVWRSLCPGFGELRSQPHVHCYPLQFRSDRSQLFFRLLYVKTSH